MLFNNDSDVRAQQCLTCRTPLQPSQLKFCCRLCEQRSQRQQHVAKAHNIIRGEIEIVARMMGNDQPEWILPGGLVTGVRQNAEKLAEELQRYIGAK